jgi:peptide/nickel transport system permease protein
MTDAAAIETSDSPRPDMPARNLWSRFRAHRGGAVGLFVLGFICLVVFVGPFIHTVDPNKLDIRAKNQGFSLGHPLGTDNLGHDILAQLMAGGRVSLTVGFTAMLLSLSIGTTVGVLSGNWRRLDGPLMRLTDLFLALPVLPLLLVAVLLFRDTLRSYFGPEAGIFILIVGLIGITAWMHAARIVRGDVMAVRDREFILAARSSGIGELSIVLRHILPNVLSAIMVSATLGIASAIIAESALSFLGLGFPSDFPTWGRMLNEGVNFLRTHPGRALWPGLTISLTVLSINYIGDAIRDALDPRALNH